MLELCFIMVSGYWMRKGRNETNMIYYLEKKYSMAEDHLLLGTDHSAELIGKLAYEWAVEEKVQWKGIYLARIVLQ
jgi:hypothetical protein